MRRVLFTAATLGLMLCFVITATAQQGATATLSGRITDPNGAVIAGAKVTAIQKATGAKRETVTNSEG
ncbi:MAG: carboxypeptidase-like regulatory domain-containing protein, partial [Blastocatellia bacterium]